MPSEDFFRLRVELASHRYGDAGNHAVAGIRQAWEPSRRYRQVSHPPEMQPEGSLLAKVGGLLGGEWYNAGSPRRAGRKGRLVV
jgi:hypothetical protein